LTFSFLNQYVPRLFQILSKENYTAKDFQADLIAGITVGLVALPLAMAFGIASGVKPEQGIYTAIIAGLVMACFGGSRVQIGGPTGAFIIVIAGIIAKFGLSGLWMVTAMAGIILALMGITGLGSMVKYIPRPVVIGFTNGIAILIAATQIPDFLGLSIGQVPPEFLPRLQAVWNHLEMLHWPTVTVALLSLAVIVGWPRVNKMIPAYIMAFLVATLAVTFLGLDTDTIGSRFGGIPAGLPHFIGPVINPSMILPLLPSALTVALLSAIESLLSAVVADEMIGDRHDANQELIGNGLANLLTPIVGGIPATGAIARTATNVRSGAKTPISGIVHSLTLLAVILFAAPLARYIPLAALAAILMAVAYRMGEWHEIKNILHMSRADIIVWAATLLLTVFANLTLAVQIGMMLAAMLYIYRVAQTTTVVNVTDDYLNDSMHHALESHELPDYVTILRIQGPFLFGTTDKLIESTADLTPFSPIVILRLRDMTALDATGLHAFGVLHKRLKASGRTMLLCGANIQPAQLLKNSPTAQQIDPQNILPHITAALVRAKEVYEGINMNPSAA